VRLAYATEAAAPSRRDVRRFLRTGLPIGGQWLLDQAAFALFTTLVARMGDAAMAACQAFVVLLSLSFMQAVGISVAASTLVGRYIGAGDFPAVRRSFRSALWFAAALAATVAVLFLAVPEALIALFTSDREVQRLGAPLVRLGAVYQLFDAAAIVAAGSLRGAGDTRWAFFVQVSLAWGLFLPGAYVGGLVLDGGLTGAWVGAVLGVVAMALLYVRRFTGGSWERIRI
jgi:MATE family multidrug resistance protein